MVAHDENIGRMLSKLDELGIADNTIVMYSTDNGPHYNCGRSLKRHGV
jgi:arylsulfatase